MKKLWRQANGRKREESIEETWRRGIAAGGEASFGSFSDERS